MGGWFGSCYVRVLWFGGFWRFLVGYVMVLVVCFEVWFRYLLLYGWIGILLD